MRILGRPTGAPEFYYAKVPIKDGSGTQVEKLQPFLLPHETFAKLHVARPDIFELHVRGTQRELQSCWNMLLEHDFVRSNRFVNANKGKMALAVPLGLHGDAGAMSKEKLVLVPSWNSLAAQGLTKQTHHIMTLIRKNKLLKNGATDI